MTGVGPETPPPIKSGSEGQSGRAPLVPGQAFGPRYHIIRLLGAGGMGAVYQAWDAELGVAVAIKVIRPEATAIDVAAELERRFKRELLLARQVTHKNVVRIHDLGRDRRHQVHHDAVRRRRRSRDGVRARGTAAGAEGAAASCGRSRPGWSPRTTPASSTAT